MVFFKLQEVRRRVDSSRRRLGFTVSDRAEYWASRQQPNEGGAKREGLGRDLMVGGELLGAARVQVSSSGCVLDLLFPNGRFLM
ncbi:unnamed protein product [Arabidopsis thaliana]|uniref:Uncharacterized protein n=1 Tax=Arabidopsis thaliana TaxID=3702 RepID=A0A654EGS8_ARATH|nr:unnamed protein product [Arabidopsis thaliana]